MSSLSKEELKDRYRDQFGKNWFRIAGVMDAYRDKKLPETLNQAAHKRSCLDLVMLVHNEDDELLGKGDADLVAPELNKALESAPKCEDFEQAAQEVIRCIHSLPDLFYNLDLNEIEKYIGRTGNTDRNLFKRFRSHALDAKKEHRYGIVAFVCDTSLIKKWEGASINIVEALKRRIRLCVGELKNEKMDGRGPLPRAEKSVVYLTWKGIPERPSEPVNDVAIAEIADELADTSAVPYSKATLTRILQPAKNIGEKVRNTWVGAHK
jgi:antitoxin component HigA of HigAB toxin-antitoxin module